MHNKILIVCGPTATGKTALAVALAKKFNGELVSADSRQIYKGMDIGTGKDMPEKFSIFNFPTCAEASAGRQFSINFKNKNFQLKPYNISGIPLWLYDVVNPDEEFSVAHYQCLASAVINDIRSRGKLPIVVGGTGLYIKSLLSPIETSHIPPNKQLRKTLVRYSVEDLQKRLQKEDFSVWNAMNLSDRQNPRRLIRKIEIAEFHCHREASFVGRGDPYHKDCFALLNGARNDNYVKSTENILCFGLTASYPFLYKKIDERVEKRVQQGIVREVKSLLGKGYSWDLPSLNTFGYKEWKDYFGMSNVKCQMSNEKEIQKSVIQRWKWDEHGYARRQMTWFKNMKGIRWVDITSDTWNEKVEAIVGSWYTK